MQRPVRLPSALVIGVVLSVAGSAAFAMAAATNWMQRDSEGGGSFDALIRWSLFNSAATLASLVLIGGALFAVANRLSSWPRTLLQIAAWAHVVWLLWILARPLLDMLPAGKLEWVHEYGWRIMSALFWGALVTITIAARAWWRPATPWVTIGAVVVVVFEAVSWLPYVRPAIEDVRENHQYLYTLFWPVREMLTGGALLLVVHGILRDAPAPLPMPHHAAAWLRRAGAAITVRWVAAIALAILSIGLVKSPGAIKFVLLVGPTIAILAVLGTAASWLGVERAELPAMPKVRLVLGAALTAIAGGFQSFQMFAAYNNMVSDRDSSFSKLETEMWTIVGPLIGIAGMVLACSAIASWATRTGNESLREAAISRAIIHAVLSVVVMLLPFLMLKATSAGTVLGIGVLVAGCAIASLVIVATVFNRAAEAIAPGPQLPEARLR